MKVLITGGTGLVGRALTRRLLERGDRPVIATRDSARVAAPRKESDPEFVLLSQSGAAAIDFRGFDSVVHLAGAPAVGVRYTQETKERIVSSRVATAHLLVEAMRRAGPTGPKRFISASGVGYYGAQPGSQVLTESAAPGSDFLAQVCVAWEGAVREAESLEVSTASLRLGVVFAKEGGALEVMARPFRFFAGGPLGSGEQVLTWVHLQDVISVIELLLERSDLRGPFNVVAPDAVTNLEFSRAIGRVLGRPALIRAPAIALRTLFGEGAEPILTGQRAVPERLTQAGFQFRFPNLEGALKDCLLP